MASQALREFIGEVEDLPKDTADLLHEATFTHVSMVRAAERSELRAILGAGPGGLLFSHCQLGQVPQIQDGRADIRSAVDALGQKMDMLLQSNQSVSLSGMSEVRWQQAMHGLGMTCLPFLHTLQAETSSPVTVPPFKWLPGVAESLQAEQYMAHIATVLELPSDLVSWVDVSKATTLLTTSPPVVPFKMSGTSDVAAVLARATAQPRTGLLILVELKPLVKPKHYPQAWAEAVLATLICPPCRPITLLTDLGDFWMLCWVQDKILWYYHTDRQNAVALLAQVLAKITPDAYAVATHLTGLGGEGGQDGGGGSANSRSTPPPFGKGSASMDNATAPTIAGSSGGAAYDAGVHTASTMSLVDVLQATNGLDTRLFTEGPIADMLSLRESLAEADYHDGLAHAVIQDFQRSGLWVT